MATLARERFTVILNEKFEQEEANNKRSAYYQTNPLKEDFMRFVNQEGGRKFTVEDWLKW